MTARDHLKLAKEQLERVQKAWDPPDWSDLSLYGFYCLESAISAAAIHAGLTFTRSHPGKAQAAGTLTDLHGLPDILDLLTALNAARKAEAYGDVPAPDLNAEDVAVEVEQYVEAVEGFLASEES